MIHLALRAPGKPFLFGAALLPRIVDIADAQYFLRDSDAQRHQRFATFDERAVGGARLLHTVVDQRAHFQQRETLPLNLEDEPLNGMLVAHAPPDAQLGECRGLEGGKTHLFRRKILYIRTVYLDFFDGNACDRKRLENPPEADRGVLRPTRAESPT